MTREQFGREFARALRFVLQKYERERIAGVCARVARQHALSPDVEPVLRANEALNEAETNLDAAIDQLADHLYDAARAAVAD